MHARSSVRSFGSKVNPMKSTVPATAGTARFFRSRHAPSSTEDETTRVTESRYGRPAQKCVFAARRFVFPDVGANIPLYCTVPVAFHATQAYKTSE